MKADIVTLCRSAQMSDNQLSITGAFNIIFVPSLPYRFPPSTVALRLLFDDSEFGRRLFRLTVMDTDGRTLAQNVYYLDIDAASLPLQESFHPAATLCLVRPLGEIELRSYGEHAIDLALDDQPASRTTFYVYPSPPQGA
jgi:hypothetical protein